MQNEERPWRRGRACACLCVDGYYNIFGESLWIIFKPRTHQSEGAQRLANTKTTAHDRKGRWNRPANVQSQELVANMPYFAVVRKRDIRLPLVGIQEGPMQIVQEIGGCSSVGDFGHLNMAPAHLRPPAPMGKRGLVAMAETVNDKERAIQRAPRHQPTKARTNSEQEA